MINTILFDLDGTLLPLDDSMFTTLYFDALARKFQLIGLSSEVLIKSVWMGTKAMIENDGSMTNKSRFWNTFSSFGLGQRENLEPLFTDFYEHQFDIVSMSTKINPLAKKNIDSLHDKGYVIVLATNPIFPQIATYKRIKWAGLSPEDFAYVTTYENSYFTKPKAEYYKMVLQAIDRNAGECLMIGNDVQDDMSAGSIGIRTYLLTDCLMNRSNKEISSFSHGTFQELEVYLSHYPSLRK